MLIEYIQKYIAVRHVLYAILRSMAKSFMDKDAFGNYYIYYIYIYFCLP